MVIQFKTSKKSGGKIQKNTTIFVVDFKSKQLVGETTIDNLKQEVVSQWGKKVSTKKKAA
jgi:hypothetical protein